MDTVITIPNDQLLSLVPKTARIVRPGGNEEDVALDQLRPGDLLRIRPGEKVPVDGVVTEGRSAVILRNWRGRASTRARLN